MDKIKYDVNIDVANATKKDMAEALATNDAKVLNKIGAFASLYDFNFPEYKEPVLVMKTEEPGTKQLLAAQYGSFETIAYDMINHLINDIIVMGAKPLVVQDAIICGKMIKEDVNKLVSAIADACKAQGASLTGGETSEQPGVVPEGVYILTSSITGIVEKSKVIDGSSIQEGDVVLAVASNGIHTNGITMVRRIIKEHPQVLDIKIGDKTFIEAVLVPHMCYYQTVKDLFEQNIITGMAHITGGGVVENLDRILPKDLNANVDVSKYQVLDIFKTIKEFGNVDDSEMLRTFNMGVGLTIVTPRAHVDRVIEHVNNQGVACYEIGTIAPGNGKVITSGSVSW